MASGRMIVNAIATDKRINLLSCDTSRLAFTWLITFTDCEGRVHGDPAIVRSMLFPRRQDVTIEQTEEYIREWALRKLIYWYEADGDLWIQFVNFDKNQPGLRKDREAPSRIPAYVEPEELRSNDGLTPEQVPVKLKEIKLKEGVNSPTSERALSPETAILKVFTGATGMVAIPGGKDSEPYAEKIYQLYLKQKTIEAAVGYLKPYFDGWCTRRTKDGRKYNRTGLGWIDWAIAGEIPEEVRQSSNGSRPRIDGV